MKSASAIATEPCGANSHSRSHRLGGELARRHSHSHPSQPLGFALQLHTYNTTREESILVFEETKPNWKLTTVIIILFFFFFFFIMHFFRPSFAFSLLLSFFFSLLISSASVNHGVFSVKNKFAGQERTLSVLKAHDDRRQLRFLAGVDLPLGGSGRPDGVGLYYAKIGIGTPSKDYYLQVDTGSDIMWVNCIQCRECPSRSSLGIDLTLYNIKDSSTGKYAPCDQEFCKEINGGLLSGCTANMSCPYLEIYGDGSSTAGYFVKDVVLYEQVSGDLETASANGSVIFGCGARQSGDLSSSNEEALDGILGFGKANSSMISQLASSGKVKKMFAHCLNGVNGGGIFAIGHVVQPKVNVTPLLIDQPHYSVNMTGVRVGHTFISIPTDASEAGDRKGTIIDSGTTLAYLPEWIYEPLVNKIISEQPGLKVHTLHDEYTCFQYLESVDDGFPAVTFYFENGLSLKVYPHDYLFPSEGYWCIGWQNSGMQSRDSKNMTLLGDLVLSNKLVVYDLEKQVIGWTEYNCSSSIEVKDERTAFTPSPFSPSKAMFSGDVVENPEESTPCKSESKKRQTTAQSSTLEVGYFVLHALTAVSTSVRAAEDRETDATISTTSWNRDQAKVLQDKISKSTCHSKSWGVSIGQPNTSNLRFITKSKHPPSAALDSLQFPYKNRMQITIFVLWK
ncbi:aspartic proteinase-like protein 2 [Senna tora]|uniref:Aspartic proteinase-like protein 2 n=1 Tax=Senna tora TaxID=362788 RepID=A0A834X343_9FABA|nr:aspartic proteinase-like protein 2 [Senna tora]